MSAAKTNSATPVGQGATIGANATIVCGRRIGNYAFVAAGAVVSRDVADHALVAGNPARLRGWVCRCGEKLPLAVAPAAQSVCRCERCGSGWRWDGQGLVPWEAK